MDSPSRTQTIRGPEDAARLFFSSAGRMGRGPFVLAIAVLAALFAAYDSAVHGWLRTATGWLVFLVLFFSACCVLSKRLHDRGRAGWWAGLVIAAFAVAWPWPDGAVDALAVAILILAAIDLGVLPGRAGFNRYGP